MKKFKNFKTIIRLEADKLKLLDILNLPKETQYPKNNLIWFDGEELYWTNNFDKYSTIIFEEIDYKSLFNQITNFKTMQRFPFPVVMKRFPFPEQPAIDLTKPFKILCLKHEYLYLVATATNKPIDIAPINETNKIAYFDGEKLIRMSEYKANNLLVDVPLIYLSELEKFIKQQNSSKFELAKVSQTEQQKTMESLKEHEPKHLKLESFKTILNSVADVRCFESITKTKLSKKLLTVISCVFVSYNVDTCKTHVIDSLDSFNKNNFNHIPMCDLIKKYENMALIKTSKKVSDKAYQKAAEKYVDSCLIEMIKKAPSRSKLFDYQKNMNILKNPILHEYIDTYLVNTYDRMVWTLPLFESKRKHPTFAMYSFNAKKVAQILFEKHGNTKIVRNNTKIITVKATYLIVSFFDYLLTIPREPKSDKATISFDAEFPQIIADTDSTPNYKLVEKETAINALTNELKNLSKKFDDFSKQFK